MPIILEDIAAAPAAAPQLTPKFFSKSLTGNGGSSRGLIHDSFKPGRAPSGKSTSSLTPAQVGLKHRQTAHGVTYASIPFHPFNLGSLKENASAGLSLKLALPSEDDHFHVNEGRSNQTHDIFFDLQPQGAVLIEDTNGDKTTKQLTMCYRMEVHVVPVGYTKETTTLVDIAPSIGASEGYSMLEFSFAPLDDAADFIAATTRSISNSGNGIPVDEDALAQWMGEYELYDRIVALADIWTSEAIGEMMCAHIEALFSHGEPSAEALRRLAAQLRYLETYPVPLESYLAIHAKLVDTTSQDLALKLSKQNLNLLISHELNELDTLKPSLSAPPSANGPSQVPVWASVQQRAAISTDEPLVLCQAGAGTGKSTVILSRIDQLIAWSVDISEITVLSFTNAAADNISNKKPGVGSMTIASMIHDIYSLNFPKQELSAIDIILNSLDIYFPSSDFAASFRAKLMDVAAGESRRPGAMTRLNVFVEKYRDETINALDTIGQSCLELEIIMAYQMIDTLAEPAHLQGKYLIIDEVQDNSIFEFIFTLKYVAKHQANMFLVGDASQTLYEFRASNPKALNTLEASGVFATFQLTTNYRSNQEILDFANVHLANIEANQAAQLRLQANSLDQPTADTFREKVKLHYETVQRQETFKEEYPAYLKNVVGPYIEECLQRGEKVAFLARTREFVSMTEKILQEKFPSLGVINLVSERPFTSTVISQYIKMFWNDVTQVEPKDASFAVVQDVMNNLDSLVKSPTRAQNAVQSTMQDWWLKNQADVRAWVAEYDQGMITKDEFFNRLRKNLLDYEVGQNAIKQSVVNERKRKQKEENAASDAPLIVSTVHGAKGLEFDNVVVINKYDSQPGEDDKRTNYVAFTRAINTEFILSYGKVKNSKIESDYTRIVDQLTKRDQIAALKAVGLDPDIASDDEVEAALANIEQNALKQAKQDQAAEEADADQAAEPVDA